MQNAAKAKKYYTPSQVAEELNVHINTVRTLIKTGKLKAHRPTRNYLIKAKDLEAFVNDSIV